MCSFVILRRPGAAWPVLIAANRDESTERAWLPPARHWDDRPNVVAGRDTLAGGTWLGLNDEGVVAAVLNRVGTLGPAQDKRSRGELVLEALDHADAADAALALAHLDPRAYRPFNLVIADNRDAFFLSHPGEENRGARIRVEPIPAGLSMVTAFDLNDPACARVHRYRPLFAAAEIPDPERDSWSSWEALLADQTPGAVGHGAGTPHAALCIVTSIGFGTTSGALMALPSPEHAAGHPGIRPVWRFAPGRPGEVPWRRV